MLLADSCEECPVNTYRSSSNTMDADDGNNNPKPKVAKVGVTHVAADRFIRVCFVSVGDRSSWFRGSRLIRIESLFEIFSMFL